MQSEKIAELLQQYFELGVAEGREGRNHDTEAGDAQRVLSEIEAEIAALSAAEPSVKALQDAFKHFKVVYDPPKGVSINEATRRKAIEVASSALSAQVQDVTGWQLVPKDPTGEMLEAFRQAHGRKCVDIASPTPTEHPDDGGGPVGYGYRAMLAAAPAKQEG